MLIRSATAAGYLSLAVQATAALPSPIGGEPGASYKPTAPAMAKHAKAAGSTPQLMQAQIFAAMTAFVLSCSCYEFEYICFYHLPH